MYVFSPAVLFGLQLLGLLPVSVNHLPLRGDVARPSLPRKVYSILLLGCYIVGLVIWMRKSSDLQFVSKTTFKITSICSLMASYLGAVVSVGVSVTSVKQKILLVEKLREIDFLLQNKLKPPKNRQTSFLIIAGLLTLIIVEVVHIFNDLQNGRVDFQMVMSFSVIEYFKLVILFGVLEVMELVLAVRERFQLVNERVLEVVMRNRSKRLLWTVALPCVETFTTPQEMKMSVPELSEVHWSLCCTVHDINSVYGCKLVTAMIFIFAHLVYFPYFLFVLSDNSQHSLTFFGLTLVWLIFVITGLLMLLWPCSMAVKEAKKTVVIVTKLMGHKMAKTLFIELESFADQLIHRDVEFTACGLFSMQMSIIVSVTSAVTTYMAIIIQFQTSSDDAEGTTTETSAIPILEPVANILRH